MNNSEDSSSYDEARLLDVERQEQNSSFASDMSRREFDYLDHLSCNLIYSFR